MIFDLRLKNVNTDNVIYKSAQGFSAIFIVIGVIILGIVVITGFKTLEYQQKTSGLGGNQIFNTSVKCDSPFKLAVSPIKIDDLQFITPLGRMSDSHVTPTDHQYWSPKSLKFDQDYSKLPAIYDIYSPADGTIVSLENHTQIYSEGKTPAINDWRLIINHDCGVSTIFIHIDKLSNKVKEKIGKQRDSRNGTTNYEANIKVKEGELIGKLAEHPFDFSMHDSNITLSGFLNPKRYENEPWKIHTVDPFDYFTDSVKKDLLTKVVRIAQPRGGKIDYDLDGKLVGSWFKEGYDSKNIDGRFWDGQLTIAYNSFDPRQIFISIGDFNGHSKQFAVLGNKPDPKEIGVGQLVKYDLTSFSYTDTAGKNWSEDSYTPEVKLIPGKVEGLITFKLKDKDTLEVTIGTNTQIYNR